MEPCMCGDTDCPVCGTLQGTRSRTPKKTKPAWSKGKLLQALAFTDHQAALQQVRSANQCSDGRKAKWFKRNVKGGRASVEVTMVVVRAAVQPEGGK